VDANSDSKDEGQVDVYKSKGDSSVRAVATVALLLICALGFSLFENQFSSIDTSRAATYVLITVFCAWMLIHLPKTFLLILCIVLAGFGVAEFGTGDLSLVTKCDPPKKINCENNDLRGIDLNGVDLQNANFQNADLSGSNLQGADLRRANLKDANLAGAKLQNSAFGLANLRDANLSNADLTGASFIGAVLRRTNFKGAITAGAIFTDAVFDETVMPEGNVKTTKSTGVPYTPQQSVQLQARSLICRDGMVLAYCQVYWSDGIYRPLPMGVGLRRGGVVDGIIYYDLQWNPSCILLYADGSIMTSYDTGKCS
jgi:hypothetical protein